MTELVYLIHFEQPYKHARHYIGYVTSHANLPRRMTHHRNGTGARLMQVVTRAGIEWRLVRTWQAGRDTERRLKKQHNAARICPVCNPTGWTNHEKRNHDPLLQDYL